GSEVDVERGEVDEHALHRRRGVDEAERSHAELEAAHHLRGGELGMEGEVPDALAGEPEVLREGARHDRGGMDVEGMDVDRGRIDEAVVDLVDDEHDPPPAPAPVALEQRGEAAELLAGGGVPRRVAGGVEDERRSPRAHRALDRLEVETEAGRGGGGAPDRADARAVGAVLGVAGAY